MKVFCHSHSCHYMRCSLILINMQMFPSSSPNMNYSQLQGPFLGPPATPVLLTWDSVTETEVSGTAWDTLGWPAQPSAAGWESAGVLWGQCQVWQSKSCASQVSLRYLLRSLTLFYMWAGYLGYMWSSKSCWFCSSPLHVAPDMPHRPCWHLQLYFSAVYSPSPQPTACSLPPGYLLSSAASTHPSAPRILQGLSAPAQCSKSAGVD